MGIDYEIIWERVKTQMIPLRILISPYKNW